MPTEFTAAILVACFLLYLWYFRKPEMRNFFSGFDFSSPSGQGQAYERIVPYNVIHAIKNPA